MKTHQKIRSFLVDSFGLVAACIERVVKLIKCNNTGKNDEHKNNESPNVGMFIFISFETGIYCESFAIAKWRLCHWCFELPFICLDAFEFSSGLLFCRLLLFQAQFQCAVVI